jgi:hypothetical protein
MFLWPIRDPAYRRPVLLAQATFTSKDTSTSQEI